MNVQTQPKDILKFCPKCGSSHFTCRNEREFFCQKCRFHFFINSSSAVAALIFNQEGKLMLSRRGVDPNKGMLDLPGGFVDPMESAEQALFREIKEELGVNVINHQYLISFPNEYIFSQFSVFTTDLAFLCKVDDLQNINPMDDITAIEYHYPEEINMSDLCSESMKQIIQEIVRRKELGILDWMKKETRFSHQ